MMITTVAKMATEEVQKTGTRWQRTVDGREQGVGFGDRFLVNSGWKLTGLVGDGSRHGWVSTSDGSVADGDCRRRHTIGWKTMKIMVGGEENGGRSCKEGVK